VSNANYSTLIATTIENFSNTIVDNVITNNAVLFLMKKAENYKVIRGGEKFVHQLLYKQNTSFGAISKLGTINLPDTDPISASEWNIKIVAGSIVLPKLDIAKNAGSREKLIDFAKAKTMEATTSMDEILGDQMMSTSVGADDIDSIPRLISETPTADTDVGGISSSANSYWRNYSHDTAVTAFNTAQAGVNAIDTSLNQATFGKQGPQILVTTKAIFTLYMLGLTSNIRYANLELGDAGFKALQYATLPLVFDDNCPTGNLYGIDTNNMKMQVLAQGNMMKTKFQEGRNQLVDSCLMYLFSNMTMGSRRTQFVVDSITG